ncbi:MAG: hypothetical protein WDN06_10845 [Asticcacaulis sp.]
MHREHPRVVTIAEESTSWPGVSQPPSSGGLGFNFKWNMGFMNDTLRYMQREPIHRSWHHNDITFGLTYASPKTSCCRSATTRSFTARGTLLSKMSGDDWQKFASLRAYYGLMWGYPGKKLLFMGQEFAQRREWSEARALDWDLLSAGLHAQMRTLVRDLNALYKSQPGSAPARLRGQRFRMADRRRQPQFHLRLDALGR